MAADSHNHSKPLYAAPSFTDDADDNEDRDELLINIRSYRCIWGTKCRVYNETPKKNEAWKAIASILSRPGR